MGRLRSFALCGLLLAAGCASAAAAVGEPEGRKGWSVNALPDISYNTDTGLILGAYADLFYYGDGSLYPNFIHRASLAACWFSKGGWYAHGSFEASGILPGVDGSLAVSYLSRNNNSFYGFNGVASPYFSELEYDGKNGQAFYSTGRDMFRAAANLQGYISGKLKWVGGLNYRNYSFRDIGLEGTDPSNTLYRRYIDYGLIRSDEASGGGNLELMAGLLYDSRDIKTCPRKGIYANAMLLANKDLSNSYDFAKAVANLSLFIPAGSRCTIAARLAYQGLIAGSQPFYMLQDFTTLFYKDPDFEGLGSRYTFRGALYCRLLGNGYFWANIEPRISVASFSLFRQQIDLVLNPFLDLGMITDSFRPEEQKATADKFIYSGKPDGLHCSAGIGGKLHINYNFILSADFGKALDKQLAPSPTVSLSTAYVF